MSSSRKEFEHIRVTGEGIHSVIKGITAEALVRILLSKYDLADVQKGQVYPINNYLDLLADIERRMPAVLRNIGMSVMSEAIFPPNIVTFEQALQLLDQAYYMNHQGLKSDEIGHYHYEPVSGKTHLLSVSGPYPCIFDEGIILGVAQKFEVNVTISHKNNVCRNNGNAQCDYLIQS